MADSSGDRRNPKRSKLCTTSASGSGKYVSSHSNIDKTVGTGVPHVRVLRTRSKPQQCKTDVVAIQRVELINGNVQDPMAVRRYGEGQYIPDVPREITSATYWTHLKKVIKETMKMKFRENLWMCQGVTDEDQKSVDTIVRQIFKKVMKNNSSLSDAQCIAAASITNEILPAFLRNPPWGNCVGRTAACAILELCHHYFAREEFASIVVINCGGGAKGYNGSCRVKRWDRVIPRLSEAEAVKMLKELIQGEGEELESHANDVEETVPDGQVEIIGDENDGQAMKVFLITVEVKSSTDSYSPARSRAWMQSLVGLANSDTSYALLITPIKAEILQLSVEEDDVGTPYQVLTTRSKIFNFVDNKSLFCVDTFLKLLQTLVGIMHKAIRTP